jgi:hypothetical protein
MLKKLKWIYNLVFLKYKPLFTYLYIPSKILMSKAGVLVYPIIERRLRNSFHRSRDYLKLRSDKEEV